jgi:hypothetical protein
MTARILKARAGILRTSRRYTHVWSRPCALPKLNTVLRQSRPVRPDLRKTLYQIDVQLSTAVDLVPILPDLEAIGIGTAQLFADDMKISQEIGRLAGRC